MNVLFCQIIIIVAVQLIIYNTHANANYLKHHRKCFEVAYYWYNVNFTWPSEETYQAALDSQRYIPQNNGFSGIKAYQNKLYLSLPRFSAGTPVTLASLPMDSRSENPQLEPYPSWDMNVQEPCSALQNVQAIEIDSYGIMWVLDGNRFNNLTACPPKIVLFDLNRNGMLLQTYEVTNEVSPHQGGWMNDLVIDESSGGFAYISEVSNEDPGIVVYSKAQNKAWKLRDQTMFAELDAAGFTVHGIQLNNLYSIDGIALAPKPKLGKEDRLFYYTPLTGYSLYALSTKILKNETVIGSSNWRKEVQYIGRKPNISDGMIIDNRGNLYFGLLNGYAIARWNIYKPPFDKHVENVYENYKTVDWPDSFGMDTKGNLYVTADESERVLNSSQHAPPLDGIRSRILKCYIGTRSYLYY